MGGSNAQALSFSLSLFNKKKTMPIYNILKFLNIKNKFMRLMELSFENSLTVFE